MDLIIYNGVYISEKLIQECNCSNPNCDGKLFEYRILLVDNFSSISLINTFRFIDLIFMQNLKDVDIQIQKQLN